MAETVMLVEDELFVAIDLQMMLEEAGWTVDGPYATVDEALSAMEAALPDCALLDVRLKDGDVFPLADRLAQAHVPIVFHSGHAEPQALQERYPAAAVVSKPSLPGALRTELVRAMQQQQGEDGQCVLARST